MPNARRSQEFAPNYPASDESVVRLSDGRRVEIRPILPSDAPELAEAIRTADAETLHARFLGGAPQLTDAVLDKLTGLTTSDVSHWSPAAEGAASPWPATGCCRGPETGRPQQTSLSLSRPDGDGLAWRPRSSNFSPAAPKSAASRTSPRCFSRRTVR